MKTHLPSAALVPFAFASPIHASEPIALDRIDMVGGIRPRITVPR